MVGYGIVKFFSKKKQFGYLYVLDAKGDKTGEEVFFHFNDGVYPTLDERVSVAFCSDVERGCQRLRLPRRDDRLVFESEVDSGYERTDAGGWELTRTTILNSWTYRELWDEEEHKLLVTPFQWRLVRQVWEAYAYYEEGPGSMLLGDERVACGHVVKHGEALLSDIRQWKAAAFDLYRSDDECDESYSYVIEVKLDDDSWRQATYLVLKDYSEV